MKRSVLVVDDDVEIRQMLTILFELEGWRVVDAKDGFEALDILGLNLPDAIVLDVMMPNMDGLTFCQSLRSSPRTAEIPIIMLSGKPTEVAKREGLQAGASAYFIKPPDLNELISRLNQLTQPALNGHQS